MRAEACDWKGRSTPRARWPARNRSQCSLL